VSAKHKLNAAYFQGALLVAGVLGIWTESIAVFAIVLVGLLVASALSGAIRR
jgi:hypothetical protein